MLHLLLLYSRIDIAYSDERDWMAFLTLLFSFFIRGDQKIGGIRFDNNYEGLMKCVLFSFQGLTNTGLDIQATRILIL